MIMRRLIALIVPVALIVGVVVAVGLASGGRSHPRVGATHTAATPTTGHWLLTDAEVKAQPAVPRLPNSPAHRPDNNAVKMTANSPNDQRLSALVGPRLPGF